MQKLLCGCLGVLLVPALGWADTFADAQKAFKNQQYKQTIKLLNDHLKNNKSDARAYLLRGLAHAITENFTHATADFTKTIELDSKDPGGFFNRGLVYKRDASRRDKAMADFDKAIELNPKVALFRVERGELYLLGPGAGKSPDPDKALKDFEEAIKLNPRMGRGYDGRGRVVLEKGARWATYQQGDKTYARIVGYDPKALQAALPDFNKAIELNPKSPDFRSHRAECYMHLPDEAKEIADRQLLAVLAKNDFNNFNRLGWMLATAADARVRDPKAALVAAKRAVELSKEENPYILDTLACAYAATGNFKAAVATQEKVIAVLKAPPKSIFHERLDLYKQKKSFTTSGARDDERVVWKHSLGSFVKVGADRWEERGKDGKATFQFKELQRTDEYIHLYDGSRRVGVRLYNTECLFRYATKESKWGKLHEGKWAK